MSESPGSWFSKEKMIAAVVVVSTVITLLEVLLFKLSGLVRLAKSLFAGH